MGRSPPGMSLPASHKALAAVTASDERKEPAVEITFSACLGDTTTARRREHSVIAESVARLGLRLFAGHADVSQGEIALAVERIQKRQNQRRGNQRYGGGNESQPARAPREEL